MDNRIAETAEMNAGFLAGLASLSVYLATLCPTVSTGDSGELISAAVVGGIAHPPGYPLYVILGKLFSFLPLSSPAFRLNLISAFFSCAAVTVFFKIIAVLGRNCYGEKITCSASAGIAFSASMFLAFSGLFWTQGCSAEVFSLNTFFALLVVYLLLAGKDLCLTAFIFGLGLANHQTLIFTGPAILYFIFAGPMRKKTPAKSLCNAGVFFALGLAVYLFLIIRASQHPALNWGNPDTLEKFCAVLTRKNYGTFQLAETAGSLLTIFSQWRIYLVSLASQFTIFGFITGLLGFRTMWQINRNVFWLILLGSIFAGPGFLLMARLPVDPYSLAKLERFYVLPDCLFCIAAGFGFYRIWLWKDFLPKVIRPASAFVLLVIPPLFLGFKNYGDCDRSKNYLALDYALNVLKTIKPGGTLFTTGDNEAFPLAYAVIAEKRRQDIKVHNDTGNIFDGLYGEDFNRLSAVVQERRRQQVLSGIVSRSKTGIFFTNGSSIARVQDLKSHPCGLLNRVGTGPVENVWTGYRCRGIDDDTIAKDYWMRELASKYHYGLAGYYFLSGQKSRAREELLAAGRIAYDVEVVQNNIADRLIAYGFMEDGIEFFKRGLALNPSNPYIYFNLALALSGGKKYDEAIVALKEALKLKPDFADAYNSLAICYYYTGRPNEAVLALKQALAIDPQHPQARQNLETIRGKMP